MKIKSFFVFIIFVIPKFANAANECDVLTTYVSNPDKPANVVPVDFDAIDTKKAIPVCKKAIKDNPTILRYQFNLARALDSSGDTMGAIELYQKLVDKDYAIAKNNLGLKYFDGEGVEESDEMAYKLFYEGCQQKVADACNALGDMYEGGHGTEQSSKKALKYYQKGANLGSSAAYYNWANYQYGGTGGLQASNSKAFKLFLKSAELGESCAYGVVAKMYADGEGIIQSDKKAKFWLNKTKNSD